MDSVAGQVLGNLLIVVVTAAVLYVAVAYQRHKALLPGPWPWPIIGNLGLLYTPLPHRTLQKLSDKYGGLMYLQLGKMLLDYDARVSCGSTSALVAFLK